MSDKSTDTFSHEDARWQSFLQRSTEPLFILNRQLYLLSANQPWVELTKLSLEEAKRLSCRRSRSPGAKAPWKQVLAHVLTPSEEVRGGMSGKQRRLIPARDQEPPCWWDIEFFPLCDEKGARYLLGKIIPVARLEPFKSPPIPQNLATLRERHLTAYRADHLLDRLAILRRLQDQVRLASRVSEPVLLVGEAGTGKTTIARMIHYQSQQREMPLAVLDCQRLPAFAVMAILLGETSAANPVAAIYLRHPGALPPQDQERLAELLQLQREDPEERIIPRTLAGCLSNDTGKLLPDLYHALSALRIEVPSIRERHDDLPHLIARHLQNRQQEDSRNITSLTADAWESVLAYSWPGNLRELTEALDAARDRCTTETIDKKDLPLLIRQATDPEAEVYRGVDRSIDLKAILEEVERRLITVALRWTEGQRTKAAELLSMWRAVLLRRIKALNIDIPAGGNPPPRGKPKADEPSPDDPVSF